MKPFLYGKTNPQNVATHKNCFLSPLIRQELIKLSDWKTAVWLKEFADKHKVWDTPHLSHEERHRSEGLLHRLIAAAMHDDINNMDVNHAASARYLLGFPRRLPVVLMKKHCSTAASARPVP